MLLLHDIMCLRILKKIAIKLFFWGCKKDDYDQEIKWENDVPDPARAELRGGNDLDQEDHEHDNDTLLLAGVRALTGTSINATGAHHGSASMTPAEHLTWRSNQSIFQYLHEFAHNMSIWLISSVWQRYSIFHYWFWWYRWNTVY